MEKVKISLLFDVEVPTSGYGPFTMVTEPGYTIPWALSVDDMLFYFAEEDKDVRMRRMYRENTEFSVNEILLGQVCIDYDEIHRRLIYLSTPKQLVESLGFPWKEEYEVENYHAIIPKPIEEKSTCLIL